MRSGEGKPESLPVEPKRTLWEIEAWTIKELIVEQGDLEQRYYTKNLLYRTIQFGDGECGASIIFCFFYNKSGLQNIEREISILYSEKFLV